MGTSDFLGKGWSFPPQFTKGGSDVYVSSGIENIDKSLKIILGTSQGERTIHYNYGCNLSDFIFKERTVGNFSQLKSDIENSIVNYEPRVTLNEICIEEDIADDGKLWIKIDYTEKTTNSRFNMVYPFYIK